MGLTPVVDIASASTEPQDQISNIRFLSLVLYTLAVGTWVIA